MAQAVVEVVGEGVAVGGVVVEIPVGDLVEDVEVAVAAAEVAVLVVVGEGVECLIGQALVHLVCVHYLISLARVLYNLWIIYLPPILISLTHCGCYPYIV